MIKKKMFFKNKRIEVKITIGSNINGINYFVIEDINNNLLCKFQTKYQRRDMIFDITKTLSLEENFIFFVKNFMFNSKVYCDYDEIYVSDNLKGAIFK